MNFLSNSLKFTNRGGQVKVVIKILNNQLIENQESPKSIENKLSAEELDEMIH